MRPDSTRSSATTRGSHSSRGRRARGPLSTLADEDAQYFTTLPRPGVDRSPSVQIKRLPLDQPGDVSVVVAEANGANGMACDLDGALVVARAGKPLGARPDQPPQPRHRRARDRRRGLARAPFNSPNDPIVASDGAIWFTDPAYGHLLGFMLEPAVGDYVYRHDPATGQTTVVADGFDKPNGIAFSPDERALYVTDSGANQESGSYYVDRPHHIKAFDVIDRRCLSGDGSWPSPRPDSPTGSRSTADGRVYASSFSGV